MKNEIEDRRVLVVEDEALVAMLIEFTLLEMGASVIGPITDLPGAVKAAQTATFDVAILDIDLNGEDSYPAADIIRSRQLPFIFHTGHGDSTALASSYPGIPVLQKPSEPAEVVRILASLMRG